MRVLDLFSGIGGFSLGLERAGMETVAFCEIDPFCRQVLRKHWPDVPIFEDVRTLKGVDVGTIDVICGGYPCQPFSVAGKRLGAADDRHLWPEYFRLIQELRPAWVIGENVAGHINMGLDAVLSDLEGAGYSTRAFVIPAVAVDARHRRDRLWIVGNANGNRCEPVEEGGFIQNQNRNYSSSEFRWDKFKSWVDNASHMADASSAGLQEPALPGLQIVPDQAGAPQRGESGGGTPAPWGDWPVEPDVGRVANGIPRRVDRLRALGNAIVPQIPEIIGRAILNADLSR